MATLTPPRGRSRSAAPGATPPGDGSNFAPAKPLIADWPVWVQVLATRRRPKPWALVMGDAGALGWDGAGTPADRQTFDSLSSAEATARLAAWTAAPPQGDPTAEALAALQVAASLVGMASISTAEAWQAALWKLLVCCQDAQGLEPGVARALAAVELPLTLAQAFPELSVCREQAAKALTALEQHLIAVLDPKGMPAARWWNELPALAASWTRARKLSAALGIAWPADVESRWRALLPQLVRLIRPDRRLAVSGHAWPRALLGALIETSSSGRSQRLARENWGLAPPETESARPPSPVSAAHTSEDAQCAVLWSDWSPRAARLTVAYDDRQCRLDLASGPLSLCRGATNPQVRIDGQLRAVDSEWEQICWQSDADVDYLELEIDLVGGWRVQRHLLLARQDRFLLLADAVLGEQPAQIDYEVALPLGETEFTAAKETNEGWLVAKRRQFSVLPLAMPEWRSATRAGRLTASQGHLRHTAAARGQALFAPLLVDLDSTRSRQPLTWRQLTVAETRVIQRPDVAVGYRAQLGRQQWIVYRSLGERGNRTLLGHNTAYEFVVARFLRSGQVDTLLQIE